MDSSSGYHHTSVATNQNGAPSLALLSCGASVYHPCTALCRNHSITIFSFARMIEVDNQLFFLARLLQLTISPPPSTLSGKCAGPSASFVWSLYCVDSQLGFAEHEKGGRTRTAHRTARKRDVVLRTQSFARSVCSNRNSGAATRWTRTGISTFQQGRQT